LDILSPVVLSHSDQDLTRSLSDLRKKLGALKLGSLVLTTINKPSLEEFANGKFHGLKELVHPDLNLRVDFNCLNRNLLLIRGNKSINLNSLSSWTL
jgi:hypothetical protein